ncbi:aspartate kinase [Solitalea sp. MAHUQ-68]|uniref:Aspartokinase n=1 Tax=Solitalea agri TaxID=2953739 RepID=A0A9X2JBQ6_9SPHI|nr:aspartate kinase [Solitalea agri]MCO4291714.1 aspartate kinase [Solitalea agri]
MQIFKFGGASVKDANGVKNLAKIVKEYGPKELLIVVSAMGKTTNALEDLTKAFFNRSEDVHEIFDQIKKYHFDIIDGLFEGSEIQVAHDEVSNTFVEIDWIIEDEPHDDYDFVYDQIVSIGELVSTKIVAHYLNTQQPTKWIDARSYIQTDNTYREGKVDWDLSSNLIKNELSGILNGSIIVTQGFIGSTSENFTTTLGREGSDYSAAIFAYSLDAERMTIWKDVPGVLNADPKWFDDTQKLDQLSYLDAIELAYYGATVIHPKTIKPLQNKQIPLYVQSFLKPEESGTVISNESAKKIIPSFIFKVKQVLISISPTDFSFIVEENLSDIFELFHDHGVKINTMHNSAISFSVSVDFDERKTPALIDSLKKTFKVRYNDNLELITIRHYNQETIDRVLVDKDILLEVRSRHTIQMVVKDLSK